MFFGLRVITTTYVYDDRDPAQPPRRAPGTPARVVSTIPSPAYTVEDRALLMALDAYEADLCHGCGHPRSIAWHSEMNGEYEADSYVCEACSARNGGDTDARKRATHTVARNIRSPDAAPLPPFVLGETTSSS